jgi:hypothetical protein
MQCPFAPACATTFDSCHLNRGIDMTYAALSTDNFTQLFHEYDTVTMTQVYLVTYPEILI